MAKSFENDWANKESVTLTNFTKSLLNGTSWVQKGTKEPRYAKNVFSGDVPKGLSQYSIMQGIYTQGKQNTLFATHDQADTNNVRPQLGSKAIGFVTYQVDAKDENGKNILDENGKNKKYDRQSFVFSASDFVKTKQQPKTDEKGNRLTYEENEFSKDQVYKEDRTYKDKNGNVFWEAKKGEPVLVHKKGSIMYETVNTDEHIVPNSRNKLPKLTDEKNLYPLPQMKNENDALEILKTGMAKAFRNIYYGTGEGWNPSKKEIEIIADSFSKNGSIKEFSSILNMADTYGRGNPEQCKRMEENIARKIEQNQKANVEVVEQTEEKKASKGRN